MHELAGYKKKLIPPGGELSGPLRYVLLVCVPRKKRSGKETNVLASRDIIFWTRFWLWKFSMNKFLLDTCKLWKPSTAPTPIGYAWCLWKVTHSVTMASMNGSCCSIPLLVWPLWYIVTVTLVWPLWYNNMYWVCSAFCRLGLVSHWGAFGAVSEVQDCFFTRDRDKGNYQRDR